MGYGGKLSDNLRQARNVGGLSYRVEIQIKGEEGDLLVDVLAVIPLMALREVDLIRPVEHIIGGYAKELNREDIVANLRRLDGVIWKTLRRCSMAGDEVMWEMVN